jgi:hypothetical protein
MSVDTITSVFDELKAWDGSKDLVIGDEKDNDKLFVRLLGDKYVYVVDMGIYSIIDKKFLGFLSASTEPAVVLEMIWIPAADRKKGLATQIITMIHQKLQQLKPGQIFAIGPLMDAEDGSGSGDAIVRIANKLTGFTKCHPFSIVKRLPKILQSQTVAPGYPNLDT